MLTVSVTQSKQSPYNGKWSSVILRHRHDYIAGEIESAPVWNTKEEADDAAKRAVEIVQTTDKFPNMCEAW